MQFFQSFFWLILLFFFLGVFATFLLILSLFFPGGRPRRLWSTEISSVLSDDFVRAISRACNAVVGTQEERPQLLNNGDEFFPAIIKDIYAAKRSINFMVYIWEGGKIADEIFRALIEKAKGGVQVRILLDGFGGLNA